eukprot:2337751-Rhodomonas_salina.2
MLREKEERREKREERREKREEREEREERERDPRDLFALLLLIGSTPAGLSRYAFAMRCTVLRYIILLRRCTAVAYAAMGLR